MRGEVGSALGWFDKYRVIRQLADALACAHAERIIHRDIKTANILLDESGEPKLADFGVSKLLGHLTVGETLAAFQSPGFASPEQRGGGAVGLESDVYSLGVVFFHMLTGEEPPPEGPSPIELYRSVDAPQPLKDAIADMLEFDPSKRPTAADVLTRLTEITRRNESLPTYSLIRTRRAVSDLAEAGRISSQDWDAAAEALVRDLGGDEAGEVHIQRNRNNPDEFRILGDSLLMFCAISSERDALRVTGVLAPHRASHDMQKSYTHPLRAIWRVVNYQGWQPESAAADGLANLIANVGHAETVGNVSRQQRQSRRNFIERWRQTLVKSVNEIESRSPRLQYSSVEEDEDGIITFTLRQPPPDDDAFGDDQTLAVMDSQNESDLRKSVGAFISMRGRQVQVDGLTQGGMAVASDLPKSGTLTVDVAEESASFRRQLKAVDAFLYDRMANPRLGAVITDPSRATRTPPKDLSFYQDWLSEDKKDAVRRAVSSGEMFSDTGASRNGQDRRYSGNHPADTRRQPGRAHPAGVAVQRRRRSRADSRIRSRARDRAPDGSHRASRQDRTRRGRLDARKARPRVAKGSAGEPRAGGGRAESRRARRQSRRPRVRRAARHRSPRDSRRRARFRRRRRNRAPTSPRPAKSGRRLARGRRLDARFSGAHRQDVSRGGFHMPVRRRTKGRRLRRRRPIRLDYRR